MYRAFYNFLSVFLNENLSLQETAHFSFVFISNTCYLKLFIKLLQNHLLTYANQVATYMFLKRGIGRRLRKYEYLSL